MQVVIENNIALFNILGFMWQTRDKERSSHDEKINGNGVETPLELVPMKLWGLLTMSVKKMSKSYSKNIKRNVNHKHRFCLSFNVEAKNKRAIIEKISLTISYLTLFDMGQIQPI